MTKRTSTSKSGGGRGRSKSAGISNDRLNDGLRILILHGKEQYLLTERLRTLRGNVAATRGEVDVIHFDGGSASLSEVLDEARSFGLMQQYKIIVVDQADLWLKTEANRRGMERYAESPAQEATLVLRAEAWHPGKLDRIVEKVGAVVKCEPPDEPGAVAFCIGRATKRHNATIDHDAAALLVQRIGCDLARLDSELGRLALMGGGAISRSLVAAEIPPSREERAWDLQSAILTGNAESALGKARYLLEVCREPVVLLQFATIDLVRKMRAAKALKEDGMAEGQIKVALRLWGPSEPIARVAPRLTDGRLAELMAAAMDADMAAKSGRSDPVRALERSILAIVGAIAAGGR